MNDLREDVNLYHKGCIKLIQSMITNSIKACIALKLNCYRYLKRYGYFHDKICDYNKRKISYNEEINFLKDFVNEYDDLIKILDAIKWRNDLKKPLEGYWVDKIYEQYFRKYSKLS